jgi:Holliday junction resolvase RusA-like endonuclease
VHPVVELFRNWAGGLETRTLELSIPLSPVPASRPRVTRWGTYYGKRYSTWKKAAAFHLPNDPDPYFGTAHVAVCLEFIVAKPKTTKRSIPIGDTDNYIKAALDAVTACGAVWKDDDQCTVNVAEKRYAEPGETPRTDILVVQYTGEKI